MRAVLAAVSLALGSLAVAQETPPQPAPSPPPSDAPTQAAAVPAANACNVDRDCPGALFCTSGQCVAQKPEASANHEVQVTPATPAPKQTQFGINLDAGIPDGLALGLQYRPIQFLRVGAAASYNGFGFGARGTVTVIPFSFLVSPTLSVEAGHYWAADVAPLVRQAGLEVPAEVVPLLQEVAYDYGNLHLGVEVGSPQHFMFYLRAGGSYIQSVVQNFGQVVQTSTGDATLEVDDLKVRAVVPSLKLGIVAFF